MKMNNTINFLHTTAFLLVIGLLGSIALEALGLNTWLRFVLMALLGLSFSILNYRDDKV